MHMATQEISPPFTDRAKKVLDFADQERERLGSTQIIPEHFLLGIIREGDGLAMRILTNLGVDLDNLNSTLELTIPKLTEGVDDMILVQRTRTVMRLTVEETKNFGHRWTGTEHLLLGIVAEGQSENEDNKSVVVTTLAHSGVDLEKIRLETARILLGHGLFPLAEKRRPVTEVLERWKDFLFNPKTTDEFRDRQVEMLKEMLKKASNEQQASS